MNGIVDLPYVTWTFIAECLGLFSIACPHQTLLQGWVIAQLGPALLDLQDRSEVYFSLASTYIIFTDVGSLLGPIAYGILQARANAFFMMAAASAFYGTCPIIISSFSTYAIIAVSCFVLGFCRSFSLTLTLTEIAAISESRRSTQVTILFMARLAGTVTSPLVLSSFLSQESCILESQNSSNFSSGYENEFVTNETIQEHSQLFVPFTISAVLVFIEVPFYCILFVNSIKNGKCQISHTPMVEEEHTKLSIAFQIVTIAIICLLMALGGGLSIGSYGFLSSFLVKQFKFARGFSAQVCSMYLSCGVLGRFVTIWTSSYIRHHTILVFHSVLMVLACWSLYICSVYLLNYVCVITCVCIISFSGFSLLPITTVFFADKIRPISGKLASLLMFVEYAGVLIETSLKGIVIDKYGSFQFIIIIICEASIVFIGVCALIYFTEIVGCNLKKEEKIQLLTVKR